MKRLVLATLFVLVIIGSGSWLARAWWTTVLGPVSSDTGVVGNVLIGPTCPVMRVSDPGACADKPYSTTLVIARVSGGWDIVVSTTADGHFSRNLVPGDYVIRAADTASLPRLSPVVFTVVAHQHTQVTVTFDSGIR